MVLSPETFQASLQQLHITAPGQRRAWKLLNYQLEILLLNVIEKHSHWNVFVL